MGKIASFFGHSWSFASGLFASLAIVNVGIMVLCVYMMDFDKNPESTWNCGALINGAEAIIYFLISIPFFFLAKFTLWTNPVKTPSWLIGAVATFLLSSGCYLYALVAQYGHLFTSPQPTY